jgi:dihydroorotase
VKWERHCFIERVTVYDLLLEGGNLIDPSQGIDKRCSVAVKEGKIAAVAEEIDAATARETFSLEGKIVTPGLIDLHCHPVAGFWSQGVPADETGLETGVNLLCDAGSAGCANFEALRRLVIERARTDVICFMNLSATGLIRMPEIVSKHDVDIDKSKEVVEANRSFIRGIKVRAIQAFADGLGMKGMEMAKRLADDLKIPLMVHIGETRRRVTKDPMDDFSRGTVSLLENGDILSHYLTWEPGGMILMDGTVYPELDSAKRRGVVLDACHGMNHFSFTIARHAIERALLPTVISTDMSITGFHVLQSLPVVMSKFLNLGLRLTQVIEMTTVNPARALRKEERVGSLKVGRDADITVLEQVRGEYLFGDGTAGDSLKGEVLLEPRMVLKTGKPMPAYSRYHLPSIQEPLAEGDIVGEHR